MGMDGFDHFPCGFRPVCEFRGELLGFREYNGQETNTSETWKSLFIFFVFQANEGVSQK